MATVFIGSRKWNALQTIMNDRFDCVEGFPLIEAIVFDARIHHKATPIYEDELTGDQYTTTEALISAMQNYINITADEVRNA